MPKRVELTMNVIEAVAAVAEKLAGSKLKIKTSKEFSHAVAHLNDYFGTDERQTWLLCAMLALHFENRRKPCRLNTIADFFGCSMLTMLACRGDIESIIAKHYMYTVNALHDDKIGLETSFQFSEEFLQCLLQNEKPVITAPAPAETDILDMVNKIRHEVCRRHSLGIKVRIMNAEEKRYADEPFVIETKQLLPGEKNLQARMMFYTCCSHYITGDEVGLAELLDATVYPASAKFALARECMDEHFILFKEDLVAFDQKGTLTDATIEITQKAKEMLLGENIDLFTKPAQGTGIIQPDAITAKDLFYEQKNEAEIARLTSSLQEEHFCEIQNRLSEKGLPKGVAVLLYGAPGTGKTETVYQLAKATGRMILHVDISQAKSCWFGESEKKIKKIFTNYSQLCRACKKEQDGKIPILLFNEADAIFSKRKDTNSSNVAQTENSMQNIILEEMEKLEGILIATTNLADNLDTAFERRFLFKIKFENPSVEAKRKIWKSKLQFLGENELTAFAENYNLSGGQIDNIVRKVMMDEVLTGMHPNIETLHELCKHEKIGNDYEQRIGFSC